MRRVLDALLPQGSIWSPMDGGGLDQLLEGVAANSEAVRQELSALAVLRNPLLTTMLADLEREYGVLPDPLLDEATRRARLNTVANMTNSDGSAVTLESVLRSAGFDLYVHVNDPPVDPALFSGEMVVNGDTYEHSYYGATTAGSVDAVCGDVDAMCGDQASFEQKLIKYGAPTDPGYWPLVFFVGGTATRWAGGELLSIEEASPPVARYAELIALINKYKPMHAWCVLRVRLDTEGAYLFDDLNTVLFDDGSTVQGVAL
jgi:hypothetical protein